MPAHRIGGYIINDLDNNNMNIYYVATSEGKSLTFENNGNVYAFQTHSNIAEFNNPSITLTFDDGTRFVLSENPTDNYGTTASFGNMTFIPLQQ